MRPAYSTPTMSETAAGACRAHIGAAATTPNHAFSGQMVQRWPRTGRKTGSGRMRGASESFGPESARRVQLAPGDTKSGLRITIRACRHDGTAHAAPVLLPVLQQSSAPPPPPLPARPGVLASSFPPFFLLLVLLSASFMAQKKTLPRVLPCVRASGVE